MLGLAGLAALLLALRAGRMSAVQAIATGRAPRPAHGYAAHRLLGRARLLPRPVTIGLAEPFARPSRTMITLAAIVFGGIAVTFGAGLGASLNRVYDDLTLAPEQVQVNIPGGPASGSAVKGTRPGPGCAEPGRARTGGRGGAARPAGHAALRGRGR
jgi:putative ABC transport system permease protein